MSSATSQSNTVLKQSTGSAKIGTSRNKTIQDVINQQEIVFDLMVSLRNESGLPLNSKVKNNQGVMYKITDSPQSVDNFIPSNISVDDDALFIKLNDGAKWACVEPESALHYISSNQPLLLANVSHKMRTQAAIKIATYGDSTTFCQGTINKVGDVNKVGVATNFGDGSIHANWQIQTPWPEHLRLTLNSVLSVANISVENRGFSGDSIYQLVKRHTNNPISAGQSH